MPPSVQFSRPSLASLLISALVVAIRPGERSAIFRRSPGYMTHLSILQTMCARIQRVTSIETMMHGSAENPTRRCECWKVSKESRRSSGQQDHEGRSVQRADAGSRRRREQNGQEHGLGRNNFSGVNDPRGGATHPVTIMEDPVIRWSEPNRPRRPTRCLCLEP
jgi:hypothetical protein